ncbi:MAG: TMEM165/GDT1 family protein [Acidobacteriota bacterium]|nr:TMEM165/GDT1 family protein [Acidobacteriota bacterium]
MLYVLLITYGTIFFTELLGDKSIYTISSLTMRLRFAPVFCGLSAAFMGKMLVAVLVGGVVAGLPACLTALTSAAAFFSAAGLIWFKRPGAGQGGAEPPRSPARSALVTFAAIFFSEWGDVGQLTAATLAAQYKLPFVVWTGATLALMTKGLLSMTLGVGVRRYAPQNVLRTVSVALCLLMGLLALAGLWL